MKHFTYEIDEKSLRSQLKGTTMPLREDSWSRFEAYSDAQAPVQLQTNRLRDFQVNINRKVVVPVAFGSAVVMLSLLLFNFVSIKNPSAVKTISSASESQVVIQMPEIKAVNFMTPVKSPEISEEKNIVAVKAADPVITEDKAPGVHQVVSSEKLNIEGTVKASAGKKARAADPEVLSSIRPDVIIEDTDPEIRPN
jgi:hypothetical protein